METFVYKTLKIYSPKKEIIKEKKLGSLNFFKDTE